MYLPLLTANSLGAFIVTFTEPNEMVSSPYHYLSFALIPTVAVSMYVQLPSTL
jgi:hypothetical protein